MLTRFPLKVAGLAMVLACEAVAAANFNPVQDTVVALGADGNLSFDEFTLPYGVAVRFDGTATAISINASRRIILDGKLDAGARSLTLAAPAITFGPLFFLTASNGSLNINATSFDAGPNFNPRGNILVNGALIATSTPSPGESYGAVISMALTNTAPIFNVGMITPVNSFVAPTYLAPVYGEFQFEPISAVPEPGTFGTMLAGFALAVFMVSLGRKN